MNVKINNSNTKDLRIRYLILGVISFIAIVNIFMFIDTQYDSYKYNILSLKTKPYWQIIIENDPYFQLGKVAERFNKQEAKYQRKVYYYGRKVEWLDIQIFYLFYPTLPKEILDSEGKIRKVEKYTNGEELTDSPVGVEMTSESYTGDIKEIGEFVNEGDLVVSPIDLGLTSELFIIERYPKYFIYTRK